MKFEKEKIVGIAGPQVHFYEAGNKESGFSIIADKRGIRTEGSSPYLENAADLEAFAKAVSDAWKQHQMLRVKIISPFEGH